VQRAVAAIGDPVARALAEKLAQDRLDRLDRGVVCTSPRSPTILRSRSARSGRLRFLRLLGLVITPICIWPVPFAKGGRDAARRNLSRSRDTNAT